MALLITELSFFHNGLQDDFLSQMDATPFLVTVTRVEDLETTLLPFFNTTHGGVVIDERSDVLRYIPLSRLLAERPFHQTPNPSFSLGDAILLMDEVAVKAPDVQTVLHRVCGEWTPLPPAKEVRWRLIKTDKP